MAALSALPLAGQTLAATLARLDQGAASFRGMSAQVRRLSHTAVIQEDTVDVGIMLVKRTGSKEMRMLIELKDPDPKVVAIQGRKLEIYYPKIRTVQENDIGKNRALLDQFFLVGFGASGKELASAYSIRLIGAETVAGQRTTRLELVPTSPEVLQHLKKLELWVNDETGYPAQQKFYLPGGDYSLVTYSNLKSGSPPDSALKLKLPKGVKRERA